ncbi:MAG: DUF4339 domain-containing protein [Verrucomicrobiae bacterium]|nr:DUF4339 domain-containing protein [Verrucomicrobiae bacterium]
MWYYARNGRQEVPVSEEELCQLLAGRALPLSTLVWRPGQNGWQKAEDVSEFSGLVKPPPVVAVPPPLSMPRQTRKETAQMAGWAFGAVCFVLLAIMVIRFGFTAEKAEAGSYLTGYS